MFLKHLSSWSFFNYKRSYNFKKYNGFTLETNIDTNPKKESIVNKYGKDNISIILVRCLGSGFLNSNVSEPATKIKYLSTFNSFKSFTAKYSGLLVHIAR